MIIAWSCGIFVVISFVLLLKYLRVFHYSKRTLRVLKEVLSTLADTTLDDLGKERAMQGFTIELLKYFFFILLGNALALALPIGLVALLDKAGVLSFERFSKTTLSWEFLITSAVVGAIPFFLLNKSSRKASKTTSGHQNNTAAAVETSFENSYSGSERLLHQISFSSLHLQISIANLEDRIYRRSLTEISVDRPVFIAALPRSGTTILLEFFDELNEFRSHSYRDMPFLLTPLLWNKFSSKFKTSQTSKERAHGDGMLVSVDSPEAFEEVIWSIFWKNKYSEDRINPWFKKNNHQAFETFLKSHLKKVQYLARLNTGLSVRYISKNNMNISRTDYLTKVFPDATIIVPFRSPRQHAQSMLRQHLNFLDIHEKDPFAQSYMQAIGHFEFGRNLKPINFNNWLDNEEQAPQNTLHFWLQYWVATYEYLMELQVSESNMHFFSYDHFCQHTEKSLNALAELVGIRDLDQFVVQAKRVKAGSVHGVDVSTIPDPLLQKAEHLFIQLTKKSFNHFDSR